MFAVRCTVGDATPNAQASEARHHSAAEYPSSLRNAAITRCDSRQGDRGRLQRWDGCRPTMTRAEINYIAVVAEHTTPRARRWIVAMLLAAARTDDDREWIRGRMAKLLTIGASDVTDN
jgi:hypothetical protein